MREAIINAFCHRDYRDPDYVHVAIFKDRVEIRNPGGLYGDLTIEKMLRGNVSKRRNPLIADLLRRIHMVEAWGRGMPLILKNAPNVKFREIAEIFITAFERPSFGDEGGFIDKTIDTVKLEKSVDETPKKHRTNTKEIILAILKENPEISVRELAGLVGSTENSVRHHIRMLHQSGILRHEGPTKGGRWVIVG